MNIEFIATFKWGKPSQYAPLLFGIQNHLCNNDIMNIKNKDILHIRLS